MKHTKSVLRGSCFVVFLVAVVFGVRMLRGSASVAAASGTASTLEKPTPQATSELAAIVNGVPIAIADLDPQVDAQLRSYQKFGADRTNDELVKALRKQALENLIAAELIYQEAQKLEIADLDGRIKTAMEAVRAQVDNSAFDPTQTAQNIRRTIIVDEYLSKQDLKDPQVPEEAVKEFYEKGKQGFVRKERAHTRHILVQVAADAKPEDKATARKKIEQARRELQEGKPFPEVAKAYSECNTASGGGELGFIERGYMPPSFDKVAFSQKIGSVSEIVETKFGFHIIETLDRQPAGITPYEETKDFLAKYLKKQHAQKKMADHVNSLKERARLEIYL